MCDCQTLPRSKAIKLQGRFDGKLGKKVIIIYDGSIYVDDLEDNSKESLGSTNLKGNIDGLDDILERLKAVPLLIYNHTRKNVADKIIQKFLEINPEYAVNWI